MVEAIKLIAFALLHIVTYLAVLFLGSFPSFYRKVRALPNIVVG